MRWYLLPSFPNGDDEGIVTMIPIPADRTPNCMGPGMRITNLISLQPENTQLSQPATLVTPNILQERRKGSAHELWNFIKPIIVISKFWSQALGSGDES